MLRLSKRKDPSAGSRVRLPAVLAMLFPRRAPGPARLSTQPLDSVGIRARVAAVTGPTRTPGPQGLSRRPEPIEPGPPAQHPLLPPGRPGRVLPGRRRCLTQTGLRFAPRVCSGAREGPARPAAAGRFSAIRGGKPGLLRAYYEPVIIIRRVFLLRALLLRPYEPIIITRRKTGKVDGPAGPRAAEAERGSKGGLD